MKEDHPKGHPGNNTAKIGGAAYAPQQDEPHSEGDERTPGKPIGEVAYANRDPTKKSNEDLQRDDRGAGHAPQRSKKDIDDELDKALKDSFPSSDPPAASQPTETEPAGDPKVKP